MKFGGHETFPVREGWLHKGLKLVVEEPEKLVDEHVADWLGVGRNMAKSIRYWLQATGLCEQDSGRRPRKSAQLKTTRLGRLIWERDPYFIDIGTWWALHVNLISSEEHAFTWDWFFNRFKLQRFDKAVCVEGLQRFLQMHRGRMPSPRTLDRDLSCLLLSYSKSIPDREVDPEEAQESPFTELGLLSHYRTSGYYEVDQGTKAIPAHILCYSLTRAFGGDAHDGPIQASVQESSHRRGGPGNAFCMSAEDLYEAAIQAEDEKVGLEIHGLAGQRNLVVERREETNWLDEYLTHAGSEGLHAA